MTKVLLLISLKMQRYEPQTAPEDSGPAALLINKIHRMASHQCGRFGTQARIAK
jgi:hypothetical protein